MPETSNNIFRGTIYSAGWCDEFKKEFNDYLNSSLVIHQNNANHTEDSKREIIHKVFEYINVVNKLKHPNNFLFYSDKKLPSAFTYGVEAKSILSDKYLYCSNISFLVQSLLADFQITTELMVTLINNIHITEKGEKLFYNDRYWGEKIRHLYV
ncbi:MAG: hypothetical protein HQK96_00350 [Nitrospirae bacterium]|nr:hypothetical protein [Nitrospirota bacterium]